MLFGAEGPSYFSLGWRGGGCVRKRGQEWDIKKETYDNGLWCFQIIDPVSSGPWFRPKSLYSFGYVCDLGGYPISILDE